MPPGLSLQRVIIFLKAAFQYSVLIIILYSSPFDSTESGQSQRAGHILPSARGAPFKPGRSSGQTQSNRGDSCQDIFFSGPDIGSFQYIHTCIRNENQRHKADHGYERWGVLVTRQRRRGMLATKGPKESPSRCTMNTEVLGMLPEASTLWTCLGMVGATTIEVSDFFSIPV